MASITDRDRADSALGTPGPGTGTSKNGVTAAAGGGQANGVLLTDTFNRVTTVATIADSVKLPPAVPGMCMLVMNSGANSMNVFPSTGDQINALGANNAYAMAAGARAEFFCAVAGTWGSILSA